MTPPVSAITGRGVVSCFGLSVEAFTASVLSGQSGIRDVRAQLTIQRFANGAPVTGFDPADHFDARTRGTLDRFSQFAVVAGRQAWAEAGFAPGNAPDPARIAVIIGTANAGVDALDASLERMMSPAGRPQPLTIPMAMASAPASRIAREIGARGPVFGVSSACASAGHAIALGDMLIRTGMVDVAVVGGTDSCFNDHVLRAWDVLRIVSPDLCRPFSTERRGIVIGEGAGVLVLERSTQAAARGIAAQALLAGAGLSCDAGELLQPDPAGMEAAIRQALAQSGLTPQAIGYINAHGTGTPANDRAEAGAITAIFGTGPQAVPVSSTKSQTGHTMGASGALEAIATIAAIRQGMLPPTLNVIEQAAECPVNLIVNTPRPARVTHALSNSFAFGGLNVSLVFSHPDGDASA